LGGPFGGPMLEFDVTHTALEGDPRIIDQVGALAARSGLRGSWNGEWAGQDYGPTGGTIGPWQAVSGTWSLAVDSVSTALYGTLHWAGMDGVWAAPDSGPSLRPVDTTETVDATNGLAQAESSCSIPPLLTVNPQDNNSAYGPYLHLSVDLPNRALLTTDHPIFPHDLGPSFFHTHPHGIKTGTGLSIGTVTGGQSTPFASGRSPKIAQALTRP
jgi:hypothetical protein